MALQILDGVLHHRGVVEPPLFFNLILATLLSHVGIVGGILEEDEVKPNQPTEKYYIGKGDYKTFIGPSSSVRVSTGGCDFTIRGDWVLDVYVVGREGRGAESHPSSQS